MTVAGNLMKLYDFRPFIKSPAVSVPENMLITEFEFIK